MHLKFPSLIKKLVADDSPSEAFDDSHLSCSSFIWNNMSPLSKKKNKIKHAVFIFSICSESTSNISYATFCQHVPFYITSPSATDWGTCLCSTFIIQFNHLIFTIHNYFNNLNPFLKKCPTRNTELRGYFCIFCIPLCKVLLCYKFRNLQKFFIYSKYGLL